MGMREAVATPGITAVSSQKRCERCKGCEPARCVRRCNRSGFAPRTVGRTSHRRTSRTLAPPYGKELCIIIHSAS